MTTCTTSSPYECTGCEEHEEAATELFYKHLIADDLTLPLFVGLDLDAHLEAARCQ